MGCSLIDNTAELLLASNHAIVLSGAGISTESGVPDFRSPGGIWEQYDPAMFFYERFLENPKEVWEALLDMHGNSDFTLWEAQPNQGHLALSYLEKIGIIKTIITQNVDNLHQKAGSKNVVEFHGNLLFAKCLNCGAKYGYQKVLKDLENIFPPLCSCGGTLKPDAVFFGEAIPQKAMIESTKEANLCDLMLVIGTSAQVEPAASLPLIAKGMNNMLIGLANIPVMKTHCNVIEINREPTPLTGAVSDFLVQGSAGEILSQIAERIKETSR